MCAGCLYTWNNPESKLLGYNKDNRSYHWIKLPHIHESSTTVSLGDCPATRADATTLSLYMGISLSSRLLQLQPGIGFGGCAVKDSLLARFKFFNIVVVHCFLLGNSLRGNNLGEAFQSRSLKPFDGCTLAMRVLGQENESA
jgi:hypothetical protein